MFVSVFFWLLCDKTLQIGWLTQQIYAPQGAGGWEAQGQGPSPLSSWWGPLLLPEGLITASPMAQRYPSSSFYKATDPSGGSLSGPRLTPVASKAPPLGTLTQEFGGTRSVCILFLLLW